MEGSVAELEAVSAHELGEGGNCRFTELRSEHREHINIVLQHPASHF